MKSQLVSNYFLSYRPCFYALLIKKPKGEQKDATKL